MGGGVAALVRVEALEGPLIRPSGTFSPRGEGAYGALVLIIDPALPPLPIGERT
jgi:hypothetical protein